MLNTDFAGGRHSALAVIPKHAAATATEVVPVFYAPVGCTLREIGVIASAAVTGVDTNTTHLNLINKELDGSGSDELAAIDLVNGTDLVANDYTVLEADDLSIPTGTVIALQLEKVGTGLLVPNLLVTIVYDIN